MTAARHSIKTDCGVGVTAVGNTCCDILVMVGDFACNTAVLCPEECECDPGGYYVKYNRSSLSTVPSISLTGIQVLYIHDNNITLLERDIFVSRGMIELEGLGVRQCGLNTIVLGAFKGLRELTELSLYGNELSEITPDTTENLIDLEYLDLSGNSLQHLDSAVFSGLVNVEYTHLEGNKLQYLHPDMLLGIPKLQHLYLSYNPCLQIPTDRNIMNSHSLSHLDIAGCNVSLLSVETFAKVSALEQPDLSYRNLRTVDINILRTLPKLSGLCLDGNQLQRDCQLQEVWQWCEDRNIATGFGGEETVCDTLSEVEGMWWGVLEKVQCLQDNIQYYGDYSSTRYSYTDIKDKYSEKYNVEILKKYQVPVYAVLFIFGTTSSVIILIIICNKDMRTVPNMYILNLATCDIIYLTVFFSEAYANRISYKWLQGDFMCTFITLCRRLSAYSVAVLSIHRYRVTVNPSHICVSSSPTWRVTVTTVCGIWIVAALFAVPSPLSKYLCKGLWVNNLYSYYVFDDTSAVMTYYQCVVLFELLVSCAIPLCVISFTYIMTALHLMEISGSISEWTQNPQLNTRRNIAKIVVGLTVFFMISYVPYHVIRTYINYTKKQSLFFNNY